MTGLIAMSQGQEKAARRALPAVAWVVALLAVAGCWQSGARSERSFDEIHRLIDHSDAPEVIRLLGEPDNRQPIFGSDEKWVWWNYTFLDGSNYPPELRGRVVHLEVVMSKNPTAAADRRVGGSLAVNYRVPLSDG